MQTEYDAVIVGGGHNGLICAAYLAKAGLEVAVFEKNSFVGGMSSTYEFIPGYKFSTGAFCFGMMPPSIREDLELATHGLKEVFPDPWLFLPLADGKYFAEFYPDHEKTAKFLSEMFTPEDGAAYKKWAALWANLTETFIPMQMNPPIGLADLLSMFQAPEELAGARRMLFYSLSELVDELGFVSEGAKAFFAHMANDVNWVSPKFPMSAIACGFHYILPAPYGMPVGGMGPVMQGIAQLVEERGGHVFINSKVDSIELKDGVVSSIVVNGEEITAKAVISTLAPKLTFGLIGHEHLDEQTLDLLKTVKSVGTSAIVDFALSELPSYTCAPGNDPEGWQHQACQVITPSLEYCEDTYNDWRQGIVSDRLSLVMINESLFDPSMAPPGKFTGKVYVTTVPYNLKEGSWDDPAIKEDFANKVINTISEYAPNFRDAIIDKHVVTPLDFERIFGQPNWAHTDVRTDQMFNYRPMPGWSQYKTPMEGLYLAGASCHGGPGVTGMAGHNAAKVIIENLKPAQ